MNHPDTVTCIHCGRQGIRGFVISSGNNEIDFAQTTWRCASTAACERRQSAIEGQCAESEAAR